MNKSFKVATLLLILFSLPISSPRAESQDDILIVANRSLKIDTISKEELKAIFLKKRSLWSTGEKAIPIHSKNVKLREQFLLNVLNLNIDSEETYWQNEKIRSGDTPPPVIHNTLKAVFKLRGSVSYVYRSQYIENVAKILLVIPRSQ